MKADSNGAWMRTGAAECQTFCWFEAFAKRPGVRRGDAALSITSPRNQRWVWNPTLLATQFARRPYEDWHLVEPPHQQPLRVLECAAPPRRFRSRHPRNQHRDRTPTLLATQSARRPKADWHLVVPPTPPAASRPRDRSHSHAPSIT